MTEEELKTIEDGARGFYRHGVAISVGTPSFDAEQIRRLVTHARALTAERDRLKELSGISGQLAAAEAQGAADAWHIAVAVVPWEPDVLQALGEARSRHLRDIAARAAGEGTGGR